MKQILTTAAVLLLALTIPHSLQAQDFYVITNGNNILAHTNATTIGNVTGNNFNINTCLWTIDGNKIIAIAPDGTTGNYLRFESGGYFGLSLSSDNSYNTWNNASDGGSPQETNNDNYYIRYNSGWTLGTNATGRAALHQVTVTTNTTTGSTPTSESYTATIGGNTAIYTTGAHNFSRTITHSATYTTTTTKTFSVNINGTNRSGNNTVNGTTTTTETYTGALTNVAWSVSPTTYGDINASTGELTITSLPTSVANLTVTFSAQAGGQPVSGTMTVMLAKDAATAENRVGGTTGVTTTTVTLNDYEPHEWAYYNKEYNSPIRSWNPANVKISYYGNGTNTVNTTTNNTTPGNTTWNTNATTVRVGILSGETQDTFVYYKTLERTDGTTAASPSGRCEYRTIANPFSVRPTFTSGSTKYYTGFYRWRVKTLEGGAIYDAATGGNSIAVGGTVDAEQVLYFAPTSEYGMKVEFEALWARAYIGGSTHVTGTNAYERNFYIGARTSALDYAATISAVYPDGTNGSNNTLLTAVPTGTTQTSNYTCGADTKFEYIKIDATRFTAGNNYLIWGRGISGSVTHMIGFAYTGNQHSSAIDKCSYRLESGTINNLNLLYVYTDNYGAGSTTYSNSVTGVRCTIGCDYDRAANNGNGDNTKLSIAPNGYIYGSDHGAVFNSSAMRNTLTFDWCIKSGKIHSEKSTNDEEVFYMGTRGSDNAGVKYCGKRRLIIEGGEMNMISAGLNSYGPTTNTQAANRYTTYVVNDGSWSVLIRIMKGNAKIRSSIYGAAVYAGACGDRRFVITGGEIGGWIAGGCNGTQTTNGELYGSTEIYLGGNAECNSNNSSTLIGSSTGGNLFGAGSGIEGGTTVGQVFNSTIVIADEGEVERNVFGGGNYGYVNAGNGHGSNIHIMGGTVRGKVFGGSNQQQGQIVNIQMTGGTVIGGVYGGSNASGTVAGPVKVSILGGTVGASGQNDDLGNVFGSGYGVGTSVTGDVHVIVGDSTSLTAHTDHPLIWGHVFGGGHEANYNATGNEFKVLGYNGTVKKNIFGGGKGVLGETKGEITGDTYVQLRGHIHVNGNVFGGGMAGDVTGNAHVILKD